MTTPIEEHAIHVECYVKAMQLYKPPFKTRMGYIYDSAGEMVADDKNDGQKNVVMRTRGWGRIQKLPNGERVQDEVSAILVDALNLYWRKYYARAKAWAPDAKADIFLKTDPEVFDSILSGDCKQTIRFNDRDFKVGDFVSLLRTDHTGEEMKQGKPLVYSTKPPICTMVTHVLKGPIYGLQDGWCILSLEVLTSTADEQDD